MKGTNKMDQMKTIDVKGLDHGERENLIFPAIEEIKDGETLRIIVEFNPVPMVYMLKAREEFDISFEKEGPDEWVLNVKRISEGAGEKKQQFKKLMQELRKGDVSEKTKEQAKKFLQNVDATSLGLMEQELIREGISHDEIRNNLCDIHLEVLKDSLVSKRIEVKAPHPVHTFMEEHIIILENLHKLGDLLEPFKKLNSFKEMNADLEALKEISHHLVDAESHHHREEDVLFPKLREHDIVEPVDIMKMDHDEFRKRKRELYQVTSNHTDYDFGDFKKKVLETGSYLVKELESHIFKEENIIYQIALQVLNEDEWQEIKKETDKIGYCCFTPEG